MVTRFAPSPTGYVHIGGLYQSIIGKKLTKTQPEGFYPMVLMTRVEYGDNGDNQYYFQTRANHSSAKTPLGMFSQFEIPNSLKLVDDTIRQYYKM